MSVQLRQPIRSSLELGRLLKQARIAADLRQRDAADLCGVSERFLIQLEQGKPGSRLDLVLQVCRGLGVSLEAGVPEGATTPTKRRTRTRAKHSGGA